MRRIIATMCLLFICSAPAFSSGFSIYEASVRANGMLGAFSAYADHVSTIYYNPAGLGGLDGIRFSGGATVIAPARHLEIYHRLLLVDKRPSWKNKISWYPTCTVLIKSIKI